MRSKLRKGDGPVATCASGPSTRATAQVTMGALLELRPKPPGFARRISHVSAVAYHGSPMTGFGPSLGP